MRLSTQPSKHIERERRLIKKEKYRYIGPNKGERQDENRKRLGKKSSWYKLGGNEPVIFVPATPNSQLQKKYQKEIEQ